MVDNIQEPTDGQAELQSQPSAEDQTVPEKVGFLSGIADKFTTRFFKDTTKVERNWIMYDAGNSAVFMFFILIGVSIVDLSHGVPFFENSGTTTMALFNSVSGLIVAVLGPVLGAIADNKGRKKSLFRFFVIMGLSGCYGSLLANLGSLAGNPILFFWIFVVFMMFLLVGLGGSLLFYDSMLADITTPERGDRISSSGYAAGYVGSLIPFILCLLLYYFVMSPEDSVKSYGVSLSTAYSLLRFVITICIVISGTWWFFWTRPLLKTYVQTTGVDPVKHQIRDAFIKLKNTFKELKKYKPAFIFIFAFFFYINGVNTIIALSATYAKEVLTVTAPGVGANLNVYLILALIMTQVVASLMSIVFGKLAGKFGARPLIIACVVGNILFVTYGVFMKNLFDFFLLAFGVGLFLGGIQALSRSYFSKLAPIEKQSEFFGLYDIFNKSSNFLGSLVYTAISTSLMTSNFSGLKLPSGLVLMVPQISVATLTSFFIVGLILLFCVPRNYADKDKIKNVSVSESVE
ncbi:MAG: MFS transporter [Christensenellaceae bacterium]|jgi:UMF1 family MFS transporter|nr:MFS transporter [Christensenellaceae bacterium]